MNTDVDELESMEGIDRELFDLMDADPEFVATLRSIWECEFEGRKEALQTLHWP